jgi:hypothetical protein
MELNQLLVDRHRRFDLRLANAGLDVLEESGITLRKKEW